MQEAGATVDLELAYTLLIKEHSFRLVAGLAADVLSAAVLSLLSMPYLFEVAKLRARSLWAELLHKEFGLTTKFNASNSLSHQDGHWQRKMFTTMLCGHWLRQALPWVVNPVPPYKCIRCS